MGEWLKSILVADGVFVGLSIAALLATCVVAVGLFLEYEPHELFGPSKKQIGSLMVAGGVALEALFGIGAFTSASIRESRSESQIVALTVRANELAKDAGIARGQIANANERASANELKARDLGTDISRANARRREADVRISELKKETEVARKDIADAEARADSAKAQIAKSNEKAEAERLERVRLEQTIAWRTLTAQQSQDIMTALKPFAGERVNLIASPSEADASTFATDLFCALSTCWKDVTTGIGNNTIKITPTWWPWSVVPKNWVPMDSAGWLASMEEEREVGFSSWSGVATLHGGHGIKVVMSPTATSRDLMAARALVCALWAQHFDVSEIQISLI